MSFGRAKWRSDPELLDRKAKSDAMAKEYGEIRDAELIAKMCGQPAGPAGAGQYLCILPKGHAYDHQAYDLSEAVHPGSGPNCCPHHYYGGPAGTCGSND